MIARIFLLGFLLVTWCPVRADSKELQSPGDCQDDSKSIPMLVWPSASDGRAYFYERNGKEFEKGQAFTIRGDVVLALHPIKRRKSIPPRTEPQICAWYSGAAGKKISGWMRMKDLRHFPEMDGSITVDALKDSIESLKRLVPQIPGKPEWPYQAGSSSGEVMITNANPQKNQVICYRTQAGDDCSTLDPGGRFATGSFNDCNYTIFLLNNGIFIQSDNWGCYGNHGQSEPDGFYPTESVPRPKPSFDCQKARTPEEKLICDDAPLATADANIATIYRRLESLKVPALQDLRASQMAWLKRRFDCPKPTNTTPSRPDALQSHLRCLRQSLVGRESLLYEVEHTLKTLPQNGRRTWKKGELFDFEELKKVSFVATKDQESRNETDGGDRPLFVDNPKFSQTLRRYIVPWVDTQFATQEMKKNSLVYRSDPNNHHPNVIVITSSGAIWVGDHLSEQEEKNPAKRPIIVMRPQGVPVKDAPAAIQEWLAEVKSAPGSEKQSPTVVELRLEDTFPRPEGDHWIADECLEGERAHLEEVKIRFEKAGLDSMAALIKKACTLK